MITWKTSLFSGYLALFFAVCLDSAYAQETAAPPAQPPSHLLRQILITTGIEDAQKLVPQPEAGFVVMSPPVAFLDSTELKKRLAPGENRPLDDKLLAAIAQVVENFLRQHDFPVATAVIPPQSISGGIVRVAVLFGKFRNFRFQGNRWFSDSLLKEKLRVEHGERVRLSQLDQALSWTNNNPFRRVRVHMEPVPGTDEVDLIIGVQERLPLRLLALYDNAGNATLGKNRFIGSISYGNLWGRDHQVSYQYITSDQPEIFKAHGLDYRVPLPWRHYLQFSASYLRATPEFFDGLFTQDGESITTELRYSFPLHVRGRPIDFFTALNFKQSNNNLAFGGEEFLTTTDIFQVSSGVSTVIRDKRGAWALSASLTYSPGEINSRNSDAAFRDSRFGADSNYVYGSFSFQRLLNLERGWEFMSRAVIQAASRNLIASEQLTAGGSATVRGFNENVFAGDEGFVFSNDVLLPVLKKPLPFKTKNQLILETRFLFFYDAANVRLKERFATDAKFAPLASTGVGVRMNVGTYLNVTADYGWQISDLPYPVEEHGRGHIKVTLAY